MDSKNSYPSWQDFSEAFPDEEDYDAFDSAWAERMEEDPEGLENRSQLLGWPFIIQNSMFAECDLVTQGYYLGNGWGKIPKEIRQRAEGSARDRWLLLFQLYCAEAVKSGMRCWAISNWLLVVPSTAGASMEAWKRKSFSPL